MGRSQALLALLVVTLTSMVSTEAYPPRAMPPALPPVKLPTLPPLSPPTKPYKPPTLPPLSPPTKPYKPPTLPPLSPPTKPYKPPTLPPLSPPPPYKKPTLPPLSPPTKPYKPPTRPPLSPPPPYKKPTLPPLSPPPPYKKPTLPPLFKRPRVAVRGVVYCLSCPRPGVHTPWGTPIKDAVVELTCSRLKNFKPITGKTDKKGFFLIDGKDKLTPALAKYCKVRLVSSPVKTCQKPSRLNYGITGAYLKQEKTSYIKNYTLFSIPILAFQSACKY